MTENKKKLTGLILFFLLVAIGLVLFFTLPLHSVTSNGFTFRKMDDGTYRVMKYTGTDSYVEVPRTVRGVAVTEIFQYAFENNTHIKIAVIRDNIVEIGLGAFRGCTSLESLTIPFVGGANDRNTHLSHLFSNRGGISLDETPVPSSLRKVYITKGCTRISTSAFYLCSSLDEVHIPSTVSVIRDGTGGSIHGISMHNPFFGCSGNLTIYCALSKKPDEWGAYWNYVSSDDKAIVRWGSKEY